MRGTVKIQKVIRSLQVLGILLLFIFPAISQDEDRAIHILRIEKELEKAPISKKVGLLNHLSNEYLNINPEKAKLYAENAIQLARIDDNRTGETEAVINLGKAFYFLFQYDLAFQNFEKALERVTPAGNDTLISELNFWKGKIYYDQNIYDEAVKVLNLNNSQILQNPLTGDLSVTPT